MELHLSEPQFPHWKRNWGQQTTYQIGQRENETRKCTQSAGRGTGAPSVVVTVVPSGPP